MTDYFTLASFIAVSHLSAEEEAWFNKELKVDFDAMCSDEMATWAELRGIDDPEMGWGFDWEILESEEHGRHLWIHQDESLLVAHVCGFFQYFLQSHRPGLPIMFEYANIASRPILDAYGGGAVCISKNDIHVMSTHQYLEDM